MFKYALLAFFGGLLLLLSSQQAMGQVRVRGYFRSNGTYVSPHFRSPADGIFNNNWSTYGNYNPYTGAPGTHVTPTHTGLYPLPLLDHSTHNGTHPMLTHTGTFSIPPPTPSPYLSAPLLMPLR